MAREEPSSSNNNDDGQGLFHGITFYLSVWVPSKPYIREKIENNGGKILQSDAAAQLFVTDHLNKKALSNAPPKAISYTFIEKSIKNGELEDIEPHLISTKIAGRTRPGQPAAKATVGPSGIKRRMGRNPFTIEDDNILFTFISKPGVKLGGNVVYQQIESLYPQHTWHSWRDRWVKFYSQTNPHGPPQPPADFVLPPSGADEPPSPPPRPAPPARPAAAAPQRSPQQQQQQQQKRRREPTEQQPTPIKMEPKPVPLAPQDDKILKRMKAELMEDNVDLADLCEQLTEDHPHHTYEEWMTRVKIFRRSERNKERSAPPQTAPASAPAASTFPRARNARLEELERERKRLREDLLNKNSDTAPDQGGQVANARADSDPETPEGEEEEEEEAEEAEAVEESEREYEAPKWKGVTRLREQRSGDADTSGSDSNRRSASPPDDDLDVEDGASTEKKAQESKPNPPETPVKRLSQPAREPVAASESAGGKNAVPHLDDEYFQNEAMKAIDALPADTPEAVIAFIVDSINRRIAANQAAATTPAAKSSEKGVVEQQQQPIAEASDQAQPHNGAASPVYRPGTPTKVSALMGPPLSTPSEIARVASTTVTSKPSAPATSQKNRWRVEHRIETEVIEVASPPPGVNFFQRSLTEPQVKYVRCEVCGVQVNEDQLLQHQRSLFCNPVSGAAMSSPLQRLSERDRVNPAGQDTKMSWASRVMQETINGIQGPQAAAVALKESLTEARASLERSDRTPVRADTQVIGSAAQDSSMPSTPSRVQVPRSPIKGTPTRANAAVSHTQPKSRSNATAYEKPKLPSTPPNRHSVRKRGISNVRSSQDASGSSPAVPYKRQRRGMLQEVVSIPSTPEPENIEQGPEEEYAEEEDEEEDVEDTPKRLAAVDTVEESSEDMAGQENGRKEVDKLLLSDEEDEELASQPASGPESESEPEELMTQLGFGRTIVDDEDTMSDDDNDVDRLAQATEHENPVVIAEADEKQAEEDAEAPQRSILDVQKELKQKYGLGLKFVTYALERTSMDPEIAEEVLKVMVAHCPEGGMAGDFPLPDIPGVFSEEDDELLRGNDVSEYHALEEKHGYNLYNMRIDFLDMFDEDTQTGDDDEDDEDDEDDTMGE